MNFGAAPDLPDIRDSLYADAIKDLGAFAGLYRLLPSFCGGAPAAVDLRDTGLWPSVYQQGSLDSCVENAVCSCLQYVQARDQRPAVPPSRLFLFYLARATTIGDSVGVNAGTSLRQALKDVNASGVCPESDWPYDVSKFSVQPPTQAYADAALSRGGLSYHRLLTHAERLHCLASGYPFCICLTLYKDFSGLRGVPSRLPLPFAAQAASLTFLGFHCVAVLGYSLSTKTFLCANSWGPGFGNAGFFELPFAYANNAWLSDSCWTLRLKEQNK